jgi:stringent starvation protein B
MQSINQKLIPIIMNHLWDQGARLYITCVTNVGGFSSTSPLDQHFRDTQVVLENNKSYYLKSIVLDLTATAISDFRSTDTGISFKARFGGNSLTICIDYDNILNLVDVNDPTQNFDTAQGLIPLLSKKFPDAPDKLCDLSKNPPELQPKTEPTEKKPKPSFLSVVK